MGTIYGYCRITHSRQSLDRQEQNIRAVYPDAVIVTDQVHGRRSGRQAISMSKLLSDAQPGDQIVFDSVSHMGDDADSCFELYEQFFNRGIELLFLKEPYINTTIFKGAMQSRLSASGVAAAAVLRGITEYMTTLAREQLRLVFEQNEVHSSSLRARTREGISEARSQGKQIGQLPGAKLTTKKSLAAKEVIRQRNKSFGGDLNDQETWEFAGISKMTFYKYKKELNIEKAGAAE